MVLGFKLLHIFFYILFTSLTLYKKKLCSSSDSAFYMMMMTSLYLAHGHGILCTRLDRLVLLNNGCHFVLTSIVIHSHFGNEFTIVVILKLITSVTFGVHSIFGFVLRPY